MGNVVVGRLRDGRRRGHPAELPPDLQVTSATPSCVMSSFTGEGHWLLANGRPSAQRLPCPVLPCYLIGAGVRRLVPNRATPGALRGRNAELIGIATHKSTVRLSLSSNQALDHQSRWLQVIATAHIHLPTQNVDRRASNNRANFSILLFQLTRDNQFQLASPGYALLRCPRSQITRSDLIIYGFKVHSLATRGLASIQPGYRRRHCSIPDKGE